MKRFLLLSAPLLAFALAWSLPLRAENPQPLSHLIEKDYPTQGVVGITTGVYNGGAPGTDYEILPIFYYGTKQLFDWTLFDTPIEFDLGQTLQFSLRNIDKSPWSVGTGLDYNQTSIRERNSSYPFTGFVPGYDMDTIGAYVFGRYQATKAVGLELSQQVDENVFHVNKKNSPLSVPYKPKDYIATETRLLVDVDLRKMDPRPEVCDSGFYTGTYGFVRHRPNDVYNQQNMFNFRENDEFSYGLGGLGEYLWQPWTSGDLGIVIEGEYVANASRIYLGETDGYQSRGHVNPHFLMNQNLWPGGSVELQAGPEIVYQRFDESHNNPIYLTGGITLGQALSREVSVALTYRYNGDAFKPNRNGVDQTGSNYVGVSTSYRF